MKPLWRSFNRLKSPVRFECVGLLTWRILPFKWARSEAGLLCRLNPKLLKRL